MISNGVCCMLTLSRESSVSESIRRGGRILVAVESFSGTARRIAVPSVLVLCRSPRQILGRPKQLDISSSFLFQD